MGKKKINISNLLTGESYESLEFEKARELIRHCPSEFNLWITIQDESSGSTIIKKIRGGDVFAFKKLFASHKTRRLSLLLEDKYRDILFTKAVEFVGSKTELGKKLGYQITSPSAPINKMWKGYQRIRKEQLEILSKITKISMREIMKHAK